MKNVLQDDEMFEKTKEICRVNFIKDMNTLLELSSFDLEEKLKLPFIIVKKLTPHLKPTIQAANVNELSKTMDELK